MGGFREVGDELTKGFSVIERNSAERNVARVSDALSLRIKGLAVKASDWAMWDDTYRFIRNRNREYIASNLGVDALTALKINGILMVDTTAQMAFSMFADLESGEEIPLPDGLKPYLISGSFLFNLPAETSLVAGILMLPENPLMVVSRPIVKSDGTGPIRGTLIFARYLDDAEFDELAGVTHLSIQRVRADDSAMASNFKEADHVLTETTPILINPLSEDTIAGYTSVCDLHGKRVLLLRVDILRDIHQQGKVTLSQMNQHVRYTLLALIISILLTGLILGAVITLLLNRSVISRVAHLSAKTVEIGDSGDFQGRVEVKGADELTRLSASINKMLAALSATHDEMQARNAEMRLLMNTLPAGLLSLDEHYCINPEFSAAAARVLEQDNLSGMLFTAALDLSGPREQEGAKLTDYLDVLKQELTSEETMASLNPFEELKLFSKELGERWISLRYFLIRRGAGRTHHILVVFQDITEEKRMAEEVARSHRENIQLKAIAEDPDLFREFLMETRHILNKVELQGNALMPEEPALDILQEMCRGVHTVKGVAGSFGLSQIVELSGQLEETLMPFALPGVPSMTADERQAFLSAIAELKSVFEGVVESARKILGDEVDREAGIFLKIPLSELKRYQAEIESMEIQSDLKEKLILKIKTEMLKRIRHLQNVPAKKGLARSLKIVSNLKKRLNKEETVFRVEGEETPINAEVAHELNTPLIHLIRNAFDHGIEEMSDRMIAGKEGAGTVNLIIGHEGRDIVITLADDGRGIDCEKVREKAVRVGLYTEAKARTLSREECYALIFQAGFSTRDKVSDVSGRGVGMDVVVHSIREKLKGEVSVTSEKGQGSTFTLRIPTDLTLTETTA
ncbi:MAG: hypothetical protein A2293_07030 [Elusimicrobia bacterium RIFOXYB2_FULL_49_7]|nr:MAG: hypothetical protein A2293_07030 [Elusimicrobia bacterium RIFOXYB2_FULL_49_7]